MSVTKYVVRYFVVKNKTPSARVPTAFLGILVWWVGFLDMLHLVGEYHSITIVPVRGVASQ